MLGKRRAVRAVSPAEYPIHVFRRTKTSTLPSSLPPLRLERSLRAPDAIQLACAASANVDLFVTNDERLQSEFCVLRDSCGKKQVLRCAQDDKLKHVLRCAQNDKFIRMVNWVRGHSAKSISACPSCPYYGSHVLWVYERHAFARR